MYRDRSCFPSIPHALLQRDQDVQSLHIQSCRSSFSHVCPTKCSLQRHCPVCELHIVDNEPVALHLQGFQTDIMFLQVIYWVPSRAYPSMHLFSNFILLTKCNSSQ